MEIILNIQNLSKNYGRLKAVSDLSFEIKKGHVYGILGPNGSGKSTTLGIILNVVNKNSGTFSWFGGKLSTHQALKKVGAIIERPNFYPYMTAKQNLQLVCKIKEIAENNIDNRLKQVNLYERRDSKFSTFSLGMKQRLAIASALLNNPEILILDEPTNGLDPQGIHEIRTLIKEIAGKGTTILLASHLLDEVEKVCDQVVVIRNGIKLYAGRVDELTSSFGLIEMASFNNQKIVEILNNYEGISSLKIEGDLVLATLDKAVSAAEINTFLAKNKIVLSHLVKRKQSLEQQFLNLTNN
ncbi:MAG: ABC transporter ATP-binding protein [Flavobacteriales bacterium CG_4_9_14_0_2_um_filter_35_242]|nr:MAG: ABC transporter ATP-binding protein [Flavobacteriaceae bacterium CG1_02_35_72]PIV17381.1 MAG: ABC transporter ATP-binding protein [Flavobacteriales bacterium CG03_land_8_20_14_0_80_35_15]PJA04741.1 MAG: ABC transporter ATP-binding protein [Flavobacteriales bacterium CG_4_10_14_0_2_um_filter_35_18]PJC58244.1 MAG: ABC transporter ATP-binding protein [Flavobacteriales bacterium CG_4_9_14_0_2_um_filter_35_242]